MKRIATLITVHNRCPQTLACLAKLYAQSIPDSVQLDVYMVDDGSTDGTSESVAAQFPQVRIIQADGSLYWNRGMYSAWEIAAKHFCYDYYLWLNDDTELLPNAINALLTLSADCYDEAIIVGATRSTEGDKLTYGGRINKRIAPCNGAAHEVERFNGNIVLVPNAVYNVLGNLDYYYRHSKGDIDYGIRARKHGVKMWQCGNVLGVCEAHATIDDWCNPLVPFKRRWHLMHMPNGMPPHEVFHLEKQTNFILASFHFLSTYVHCLFPQFWPKRC